MYAKMMTKQALCDAVYTVVFRAEKPLTRMQICTAIGKKKSPHIVKMIEHLYNARWFERQYVTDEFGRDVYVYSVDGAERKTEACADVSSVD